MANNQSKLSADDMFDLLDKEIDDIADLPEFKVPDTGLYKLTASGEVKEINNKPAYSVNFVVREVVELEDSSIEEKDRAKVGDKFNIAFILKDKDGNDSEIAWGKMKELFVPFSAFWGITNTKAIAKKLASEQVDITAVVVKKQRKDDKDKFSADVRDVVID